MHLTDHCMVKRPQPPAVAWCGTATGTNGHGRTTTPCPDGNSTRRNPASTPFGDAQHRLPTQTRPAPADFGDGVKTSQAPPTTSLLGVGSSNPWKTPRRRQKPCSNGIKQGGLTNPWGWLQAKRGPTTPSDVGHPTRLHGPSCQPAMRGRILSICRAASGWVTKDTG